MVLIHSVAVCFLICGLPFSKNKRRTDSWVLHVFVGGPPLFGLRFVAESEVFFRNLLAFLAKDLSQDFQ